MILRPQGLSFSGLVVEPWLSISLWVYFLAICGSSLSLSVVLGETHPLLLLFLIAEQTFSSDDFLFKGTWSLVAGQSLLLALSSYGICTFVRRPLNELSFLVPVALADNT